MPIIKSAIKALRKDKKRTIINKKIKSRYRLAVKKMRANPSSKNLKAVYSALDKASKKKVTHKNKASRLKSKLAKLLKSTKTPKRKSKK